MNRLISNCKHVFFFFSVLMLINLNNDVDRARAVKIYDSVVFLTATEDIEIASLIMAVESIDQYYMFRDEETYELAWWGAINGLNTSLPVYYDEEGLAEVLTWLENHDRSGYRVSSDNMQHFVRFYKHIRSLYPEIPTDYLLHSSITGSVQVFDDPFIFYDQFGNYIATTSDNGISDNGANTINYSVIDHGGMCVGYIKLQTFTREVSAKIFVEALANVRKVCAETEPPLILDLRDNLGGSLETAIEIADLFLKEGVIATERHVDFDRPRLATATAEAGDMPIVLITNQWSASATEVLVAALLEREKTYLIGTDPFTYGKSIAQLCGVLLNSKKICVRAFEILPPSGISYQGQGIAVQHVPLSNEADSPFAVSCVVNGGMFEFLNENALLRAAIEYIQSQY